MQRCCEILFRSLRLAFRLGDQRRHGPVRERLSGSLCGCAEKLPVSVRYTAQLAARRSLAILGALGGASGSGAGSAVSGPIRLLAGFHVLLLFRFLEPTQT